MLGIIYNTGNKDYSSENFDLKRAAEHIAKITTEQNSKKK